MRIIEWKFALQIDLAKFSWLKELICWNCLSNEGSRIFGFEFGKRFLTMCLKAVGLMYILHIMMFKILLITSVGSEPKLGFGLSFWAKKLGSARYTLQKSLVQHYDFKNRVTLKNKKMSWFPIFLPTFLPIFYGIILKISIKVCFFY